MNIFMISEKKIFCNIFTQWITGKIVFFQLLVRLQLHRDIHSRDFLLTNTSIYGEKWLASARGIFRISYRERFCSRKQYFTDFPYVSQITHGIDGIFSMVFTVINPNAFSDLKKKKKRKENAFIKFKYFWFRSLILVIFKLPF